jgi:hypothetical protein
MEGKLNLSNLCRTRFTLIRCRLVFPALCFATEVLRSDRLSDFILSSTFGTSLPPKPRIRLAGGVSHAGLAYQLYVTECFLRQYRLLNRDHHPASPLGNPLNLRGFHNYMAPLQEGLCFILLRAAAVSADRRHFGRAV